MCEQCGCDSGAQVTATNLQTGNSMVLHEHDCQHCHAESTTRSHRDAGRQDDVPSRADEDEQRHGSTHLVELGTRVLAKNDALAASNRAWLMKRDIFALNLMGAPGAGKTTLLERTIRDRMIDAGLYVVEGDQATTRDGERIRRAGASAVQVNTGSGCHLDAHMVAHGLATLTPSNGAVIFIENVGNLVCPALFDLGEHRRIAILSVTEGDDKPLKYPHMFRKADLMVLNKVDLLPYVDFDVTRAIANAHEVNPDMTVLSVSASTGQGLDAWHGWLRAEMVALRGRKTA